MKANRNSGWARRRRARSSAPSGLIVLSLLLVPLNVLFFSWFLNSSLPWMSRDGACRGAFGIVLPISGVIWLLCSLEVRAWLSVRKQQHDSRR